MTTVIAGAVLLLAVGALCLLVFKLVLIQLDLLAVDKAILDELTEIRQLQLNPRTRLTRAVTESPLSSERELRQLRALGRQTARKPRVVGGEPTSEHNQKLGGTL